MVSLYIFSPSSARIIGMKLRESSLPSGWYPRNPDEIRKFLTPFGNCSEGGDASGDNIGKVIAAIAPHAGWYYSGKIAAKAVASLDRDIDTVVVIGGHLPAAYPPLFAMEDAVSTPFGNMIINTELRNVLYKKLGGEEDRYRDNTVEVLLPMVRFFFPKASLLWLRLPAEIASFAAGKTIATTAADLGCTLAVLGSTDLTHYGPNYGFTPKGIGPKALQWVQETNDRLFIEAVESGDPALALERAETDSSSCSVGAVLGAMGNAAENNCVPAHLLEYSTSAAVSGETPDSFVGYAAFTWGIYAS
jgi:AmmeMemoRadiSam system protein B